MVLKIIMELWFPKTDYLQHRHLRRDFSFSIWAQTKKTRKKLPDLFHRLMKRKLFHIQSNFFFAPFFSFQKKNEERKKILFFSFFFVWLGSIFADLLSLRYSNLFLKSKSLLRRRLSSPPKRLSRFTAPTREGAAWNGRSWNSPNVNLQKFDLKAY